MASSNFIDHVRLCSRSGAGGAGSVHFRREKHVPKGGPDGGNGGRGGHIIVRGNSQLWTLLHLRYKKHVIATDGRPGDGGCSSGAEGQDIILEVPLGTVVKDIETGEIKLEITEDGEEQILTPGGRGGLGNYNFKSATNQTPRYAQPGEEGIEEWVVFELKLLADVGLVGFPNAGKSTLLSVLSAAKPEIGDYPFTTIVPNLGVVEYRDFKSFVMADIPGIIEGAAEGKGLGTRFLRHIERNSTLLFLIPADTDDPKKEYNVLLSELERYNPELLDKKRLVAVTKCDLLDDELIEEFKEDLPDDVEVLFISSVAHMGLTELKDKLWDMLNKQDEE
ncbi:GTPase Obg [Fulvitalea axinellae]|uniref:GTPase Obg n=1 Tax=Fulvitalea axinellae TaxID=1182444 RepID=A0AAU9CF31_9BACT|nr:GTPase Obg [Fulvitalea axinellae]